MKIRKLLTSVVLILFLFPVVSLAQVTSPNIGISILDINPDPIQPGQVMDLYIKVQNDGRITQDSSLEIVEEYPFTLEQSQDIDLAKYLGGITYSQRLLFRVRVAEDAKDGITPLRIRFKENKNQQSYYEEIFDINVGTFDARLNVIKVSQDPKYFKPGGSGKLIITLRNEDDQTLKNIDLNLDLTNSFDPSQNIDNVLAMQSLVNARLEEVNRRVASGLSPLKGATPMMSINSNQPNGMQYGFKALAPVGSSNQKTIKMLQSNKEIRIEFELMALPDSSPNIYAVPLYLNYNDEDNNPFQMRVDIPVTINSEPDLFVELKKTNLRTTDFAAEIVFTVANRGLTDLNYVTLELGEDDTITLLTAPRTSYIGNLAPGESKDATYQILANEDVILLRPITEYLDSFNNNHRKVKDISFTIINKNYYRDLPYEMWITWLILGLVILALTSFYVKHMSKTPRTKS